MTVNSLGGSSNSQFHHLLHLTKNIEKTIADVKQHSRDENIAIYVARQISATQKLDQAVKHLQKERSAPLPETVLTTLQESKQLIRELAHKIRSAEFVDFLHLDADYTYVDRHRLLMTASSTSPAISDEHYEWHLQLGLFMNLYVRAANPDIKKEITFLVLNYLAKAAPYAYGDLSLPVDVQDMLSQMFDHGLIEPGIVYNRENPVFEDFFLPFLKGAIAPAASQKLFVIGTKEIQDLLDMWFSLIPTEKDWAEEIVKLVRPHMAALKKNQFDDFIEPPLLFDLTPLLGEFIHTGGAADKHARFEDKLAQVKDRLSRSLEQAVARLTANEQEKQQLLAYLRANITCICRGNIGKAGYISLLPEDPKHFVMPPQARLLAKYVPKMKDDPEFNARQLCGTHFMRASVFLNDFISATGIRLGSLEGREALAESHSLEDILKVASRSLVSLATPGPNIIYYKQPSEILQTNLFKRFERLLKQDAALKRYPYLAPLGRSTLQIIKGLVAEINKEQWNHLNANPETRLIVQTALVRLQQHLAKAENHHADFGKFTRHMELVHYDIATLLRIFAPFKREDFAGLYQNALISPDLKPFVRAGLAKTSMNAFAGIRAATATLKPHPISVYQPGAHFEIVRSMSRHLSLEDALQNQGGSADLYLCEFNHNVNFDSDHDTYEASDVKKEIDALLMAKSQTDHLTIALDDTMDFQHSRRVSDLLNHFAPQIKSGKMNFIVFRSGQKFDMLGMDNYYGSPFYMVNNGAECWLPFNRLLTHDVHQTDLLSTQWFCLVSKYAPEATDQYRRMIFENARKILDRVPEALKQGSVKVRSASPKTETCFIDIKVCGEGHSGKVEKLKQRLFQKFAEHNAKIHTRGGYGYFHPNVCFFSGHSHQSQNIRINPGLDPKETELIIEFLEEFPKMPLD